MKSAINLKRLVLMASCLLLVSVSAFAQESKIKEKDVPPVVVAAFKSAYPNATVRGYAKETERGKTFYEIESKDGATMRDLLYNPDGTAAVIEETIAASDLPAEAQQTIKSKYPRGVVSRAEKVTEGDTIKYEVSIRNGKRRTGLGFDADGKLLKK